MARKFLVDLDLNQNQLLNGVIHKGTSEPTSAVEGQIFFNTSEDKLKIYDGSAWIVLQDNASALLSDLNDTDIQSVADAQVLIYNSSTGKWENKTLSGDISVDNTGAVTINDGAVQFDDIDSNAISSDLANDASSTKVARADAVKSYVDNAVATTDAFTLKGEIDASTNPDYPAADAGDAYVISVAGKVGWTNGTPVEVGDMIICKQDGTASWDEATVGDKWIKIQRNTDYATTDVMGLVKLATQAEAEAKSDTQKVVTPATLVNYTKRFSQAFGNTTDTSYTITHNLDNKFVVAKVYDSSTGAEVETDITLIDNNSLRVDVSTAPGDNALTIAIIG